MAQECEKMHDHNRESIIERMQVVEQNGQTYIIRELFLPPFPKEEFDIASRSFGEIPPQMQDTQKLTGGSSAEIRGVLLDIKEEGATTNLLVAFSNTPNHPMLLGTLLQAGIDRQIVATSACEGISVSVPACSDAKASMLITQGEGREPSYVVRAETVPERSITAHLLARKMETISRAIFSTSEAFMPTSWGQNATERQFNFQFHPRRRVAA